MPNEQEMLKHLIEARNILKPEVRAKIKMESYLGEKTDLQILNEGLELTEQMYNSYLAIRPIEAEREFGTLTSDIQNEIKKLTPKPKPVVAPSPPPKATIEPVKTTMATKKPRKPKWS